jgi:hypothetical protein
MYGIETVEERNADLDEFRRRIESPERCAQYSWDVCLVFDMGSPNATIAIPKVLYCCIGMQSVSGSRCGSGSLGLSLGL